MVHRPRTTPTAEARPLRRLDPIPVRHLGRSRPPLPDLYPSAPPETMTVEEASAECWRYVDRVDPVADYAPTLVADLAWVALTRAEAEATDRARAGDPSQFPPSRLYREGLQRRLGDGREWIAPGPDPRGGDGSIDVGEADDI